MTAPTLDRWQDRHRRVLRLAGTFDAETAALLRDVIRRDPALEFVVDVSHLRGLDEVGVAALARVAASAPRRVALRGLSAHQERILAYLGGSG